MRLLPTALFSKVIADLRASYWFIPAILVAVSIVLSLVMSFIDRNPDILPVGLPDDMLYTQTSGARAVLSVIATSVIGVAGVMFSVTIVAVSFASGKYGPRLIGNFMRDRGNQWSMGILIAVFVFALMALRAVHASDGEELAAFVPQYSLWVAIGLALVAVGTMIYFVHHIPETINVSRITAQLGARLERAVRCPDLEVPEITDDAKPGTSAKTPAPVTARTAGYLQTVDVAGIDKTAREIDAHVTLLIAPGAFVAKGDALFHVDAPDLDHDQRQALAGTLAFGIGPSEDQNATFIADQLVEMATRALSPGVNDPFTAIDCLNWLYAALVRMIEADHPDPVEHPFITLPHKRFVDMLASSFGAAAPYVATDKMTQAHADALLSRLRAHATGPDKAAITRMMNAD